ncbi:TraB/GumN family protein [Solemya velum gill symbiont]|uniref:Conjugal transfer protein TraB n=1 Tax=Solemya velum gill symbiont TaxID=2340 RepID=A0A0B0H1F7_SOVGS|nr:TraB/GumN family protein [Solemya velum gill symbiont]KHF24048.1 pheromone shutdown-like protein [Solemya velum gill symbiont]OOY36187.1 conjugal transfer protein TraB [Solemya velum gill symbiont]OOY39597.1 conjugal transfer protein TraB [Solemya velum gill symbiont]OOY45217.1 conjugal transfer protein TraB [Solemya velum gill symbiont]OOY47987.1 conjugal transfer protein TraB [Solemya velum gill symbiont]
MTSSEAPLLPVVSIETNNCIIDILGTAHVSKSSADDVRHLLDVNDYDCVAVELCHGRYQALTDPDALSRMDLFSVIKNGKTGLVAAQLALGAYQQRLAEQFGIEPGAEQRAAIKVAREQELPLIFADRDIGITLKRISANVSWWKRAGLIMGLIGSVLSRDDVSEEEIERLKEGDMLETTFSEFAAERQDLYLPLIDERDRFMTAKLLQESQEHGYGRILAVVGAGHQKGINNYLEAGMADPAAELSRLNEIPKRFPLMKFIPWIIVAVILTGFAIGFSRSSELGWELVIEWVVINGGLSALGALIAAAHPLTVITAFAAAPLTSLNPTVGAGMVTAAVETWLRKPTVGHFQELRHDVTHWKGWWKNRVSRILLVFLLSTLGSAAGTYIAGFRIFDKLIGG